MGNDNSIKKARKPSRRATINDSLLLQLEMNGASTPHFRDMVNDYMRLWDVKESLIKDIRQRGVSFKDYSSTGVLIQKNNPSVKELQGTNRQMLAILKELGLTTDKVGDPDVDI